MPGRDYYLQQQIEKLGEALQTLSAFITDCTDKKKMAKGLELINQGLLEHLNLNIEEIVNISLEHFIATITVDNVMDNKNLDSFANLLFHTAKLFELQKEKETAKRLFHRSLIIYKFLLKVEDDFPYERHLRIKELSEILLQ